MPSRLERGEPLDERTQLRQVFQPRDADKRQLDQQPPVQTASHPGPALRKNLQRRQDRVDRPALDDALDLRPLPGRDRQQHRLGTDGQHQGITREVDDPGEDFRGLDALAGALFEQAKRRRGIVIGQCFDHRQQSLVARRPQQAVDDLDRQQRAARSQKPIQERLRIAQRAAGAAGDDLQGLGLGFDVLLLGKSRPASPRSPRA